MKIPYQPTNDSLHILDVLKLGKPKINTRLQASLFFAVEQAGLASLARIGEDLDPECQPGRYNWKLNTLKLTKHYSCNASGISGDDAKPLTHHYVVYKGTWVVEDQLGGRVLDSDYFQLELRHTCDVLIGDNEFHFVDFYFELTKGLEVDMDEE